VLPLLPVGPYGPLDAVRPRELWAFVLFFSGLSFGGWLTRRAIGPRQGLIVWAILGGLVSSTSVTTALAHQSRSKSARLALGAGAVAACTVMLVRVAVACAVLNPALAMTLPRYLGPSFLLGIAVVALAGWRGPAEQDSGVAAESPLQLAAALKMAGLFQLVLFVILWVQARWSVDAIVATSMLVGLTDVDALTLSLARGATGTAVAATGTALAAGVLANTALKLAIAAVIGRGAFRAVTVGALGAMTVLMGAALWLSGP
jgi:uncharacterized membrane protein (DUF4010 family)